MSFGPLKNQTKPLSGIEVLDLAVLKTCLTGTSEVTAAYLFGSAAKNESVVNDLDILVLLRPDIHNHDVYFDLTHKLNKALGVSEDRIDLLFFDIDEADPMVLYDAVKRGVLLKNSDPNMLADSIDALSRYFLENEPMIERARHLRRDRVEDFCAN